MKPCELFELTVVTSDEIMAATSSGENIYKRDIGIIISYVHTSNEALGMYSNMPINPYHGT